MENQNSVCYINKIGSIVPIDGADKIELASVNGWTSIVQKDIHKVGDLVLCVVTDAVIPEHLALHWGVDKYLRKGHRVRTVKLKGVYSECILIPFYEFENLGRPSEGTDMMSNLGIFKYEQPENTHTGLGNGQPRTSKNRTNQNFNKYYKFPNYKNVPNIFNENDDIVITRKIHGSNARYGILRKNKVSLWGKIRKLFGSKDMSIDYEYVYGSHNVQKYGTSDGGFYKTDIWAKAAERQAIEPMLWITAQGLHDKGTLGKGIVIFGEVFGPGVQGEKYTYGEKEVAFQAFDIELDGEYVDRKTFLDLCFTETVPLLYAGKWFPNIERRYVLNQFINDTKIPHEGVVISSIDGNRQKMAKVINPEYHTYAEKHLVPDGH